MPEWERLFLNGMAFLYIINHLRYILIMLHFGHNIEHVMILFKCRQDIIALKTSKKYCKIMALLSNS